MHSFFIGFLNITICRKKWWSSWCFRRWYGKPSIVVCYQGIPWKGCSLLHLILSHQVKFFLLLWFVLPGYMYIQYRDVEAVVIISCQLHHLNPVINFQRVHLCSYVVGTIRLKQLHQGSKLDITIRYANFQRKYYAFAKNTETPTPNSFKISLSFCWGTIGLCFVDCSDDLCTFGMFFVSPSWGGGWFAMFGESDFFLWRKPRVFAKKGAGKNTQGIIIIQCKDGA